MILPYRRNAFNTSMKTFMDSQVQFNPALGCVIVQLQRPRINAVFIQSLKRILQWIRYIGNDMSTEKVVNSLEKLHKSRAAISPSQAWSNVPIDDTVSFYLSPTLPNRCIVGLNKPISNTEAVNVELGQTVCWDRRYFVRLLRPKKQLAQHGAGIGSSQCLFGIPVSQDHRHSETPQPLRLVVRNLQQSDIVKCIHSYIPRLRGFESQTYILSQLHYLLHDIPPPLIPTIPCISIKYNAGPNLPWRSVDDRDCLVAIPSMNINFEPGLFQSQITRASPLPLQSWPISLSEYYALQN